MNELHKKNDSDDIKKDQRYTHTHAHTPYAFETMNAKKKEIEENKFAF